jgi:hypothetical protein
MEKSILIKGNINVVTLHILVAIITLESTGIIVSIIMFVV